MKIKDHFFKEYLLGQNQTLHTSKGLLHKKSIQMSYYESLKRNEYDLYNTLLQIKKNNADPQLVSWLFTSHQNSLDDFVWLGLLQTTCISTDIWHIWFVSNLYILCQGAKVTFGITKFIMSRSLVEEKYQMRLLCKTLWREEPWFYHDILPHLTYLMFWGAMVMNPWEEIWLVMGVWGCEASHWSVSSGQTAVAVELVLSWRNDGHWLALT